MKLKLIYKEGDKRPKVIDATTGAEVEGIVELSYNWEYHSRPRVTLTIASVEVEAELGPWNPAYWAKQAQR